MKRFAYVEVFNFLINKVKLNFNLNITILVSQFNSLCGDRQWAFERVIGATLQGFDELEQANVQSRADCQRLCLEQTAFVCRYVHFYYTLNIKFKLFLIETLQIGRV